MAIINITAEKIILSKEAMEILKFCNKNKGNIYLTTDEIYETISSLPEEFEKQTDKIIAGEKGEEIISELSKYSLIKAVHKEKVYALTKKASYVLELLKPNKSR